MKTRLIAALAILAVAAAAFAQPAAPPRARILAKVLDLTPDQIAAWKQIESDAAATIKPLATSARETRQQLQAALQAPSPDPAAVGRLAIALHATREQIKNVRADVHAKLVATLTPEQKTKFDALEEAAKLRRRGPR